MDVDKRGKVWIYKPTKHKTAHHGHTRAVAIGPRAQKVLERYLLRAPGTFCFSPAEAHAQRLEAKRKERKTPVQPSQQNRRKEDPERTPGTHWTPAAYARAIDKSITAANKANQKAAQKQGLDPVIIPHWHSHQLRHTAATNVRREFGLDAARAVLGQRSLQIADTYAEIDQTLAAEAVKRLG
jgi:integrase